MYIYGQPEGKRRVFYLEYIKSILGTVLFAAIFNFMLKNNLNLPGRTVLVTGAAGFIGGNLAGRLLEMGVKVIGID